MMLRLSDKYSLGELIQWIKTAKPAKIEMTRSQADWYMGLVRQHTFDRPLKFMRVPIIVIK